MPFGTGGEFTGGGTSGGGGGGGSGTVTSVSVVSANGISGTVATASTTPAITLSTTVAAGIVKSNGSGGFALATSGTDYPAVGVITAGGPTGGSASIPVITYNANGQLTAVTTAATVGSVSAADATITIGGTATAPTIQRAALTGDITTSVNAATLVGTANVESIIRANTLDQMGAPAANLSMNSKRLTTMGQGIVSTDAPDLSQLVGLQYPYVVTGCVWTADSSGSTLAGSMTAGSVMIKGILLTVAAVTSRTFTASVDTYVDFADNGDGTANITYTTVGNNAASPALANSGTISNTLRNAIIVSTASALTTGAGTINQGSPTIITPGTTAQTSTVAAGSNGANITATTLAVAANTLPAAGQITIGHSTQLYTLNYTSGGGTTTLSGVTVVGGSGTVSTGDVVTTSAAYCVTDSLGNPIYNTNPNGGLIGMRTNNTAFTTTQTSAVPLGTAGAPMIATYIIPPGPSRRVKAWLNLPLFGSSAAAGTTLTCVIAVGNNTANLAYQAPKVNVTSDQTSISLLGMTQQAPGTYTAQVWVTQGAAGTLTAGIAFALTQLAIELF